jgi:hypothetical protein
VWFFEEKKWTTSSCDFIKIRLELAWPYQLDMSWVYASCLKNIPKDITENLNLYLQRRTENTTSNHWVSVSKLKTQ